MQSCLSSGKQCLHFLNGVDCSAIPRKKHWLGELCSELLHRETVWTKLSPFLLLWGCNTSDAVLLRLGWVLGREVSLDSASSCSLSTVIRLAVESVALKSDTEISCPAPPAAWLSPSPSSAAPSARLEPGPSLSHLTGLLSSSHRFWWEI